MKKKVCYLFESKTINITQDLFFNNVAKPTRNHNCAEPCAPISLSSDNYVDFFPAKMKKY